MPRVIQPFGISKSAARAFAQAFCQLFQPLVLHFARWNKFPASEAEAVLQADPYYIIQGLNRLNKAPMRMQTGGSPGTSAGITTVSLISQHCHRYHNMVIDMTT